MDVFDYRYRAITSKTKNIDLLELLSLGFSTSFWNWSNITVNVLIYGFVYRPGVDNFFSFSRKDKTIHDNAFVDMKVRYFYVQNENESLNMQPTSQMNLLAPYICA